MTAYYEYFFIDRRGGDKFFIVPPLVGFNLYAVLCPYYIRQNFEANSFKKVVLSTALVLKWGEVGGAIS